MPITDTIALGIQRKRQIGIKPDHDGKWRAYTAQGTAINTRSHDDPTSALEEAESLLTIAETKSGEHDFKRLRLGLEVAQYVPWPQTAQDGTMEWAVMKVSDRSIESVHSGWIRAAMRIAELAKVAVANSRSGDGINP